MSDDFDADAAGAASTPRGTVTPRTAGASEVSVRVPDIDGLGMFLAARTERDALEAITRVWAPFLAPIAAQPSTAAPAAAAAGASAPASGYDSFCDVWLSVAFSNDVVRMCRPPRVSSRALVDGADGKLAVGAMMAGDVTRRDQLRQLLSLDKRVASRWQRYSKFRAFFLVRRVALLLCAVTVADVCSVCSKWC